MNSSLKLIIFGLLITRLQCYVVTQTAQQIDEEGRNDVTEHDDTAASKTSSPFTYIGKIVKPTEIKEAQSLEEIINFVGSDKLSNIEATSGEEEGGQETLTYTELSKRLALWQWAQEHNFYDMQTQNSDSISNVQNNFVTGK